MQVRIMRFLLVVVVCGLVLSGMALAQTDDEAREVVLSAVQNTVALEGYHLTVKSNYLNSITQTDGFVTNTYTIQIIEGDVAQNGDRQFNQQIQSGDSFEGAVDSEVLVVELIVSGGETYVNFHIEDTVYADMLDIQPGWWLYEQLIESVDGSVTAFIVRQYAQTETPLETIFRDDIVLSVEELEPEVDGGVNLRVFDVELDAVQLLLEQTAATNADQEEMLEQGQDLLAASDITATYRLWIGTDDGLVYRGKGEQRSVIPYATAGTDSDPDFDLDGSGTIEFTISQHGEAVEITPPDADLLNE